MSELQFDHQVFKVYQQKVSNAQSSRTRSIQNWQGQLASDASAAAEDFLSRFVPLKKQAHFI